MNYYIYINNILGVKTNLDYFSWVYGRVAPKVSKAEFDSCKIKINLMIKKTNETFEKSFKVDDYDKYNYFYARKNENKIFYDRPLFLKSKLRYSIEINDNSINVVMNRNYYKFIKYRFMNLHSLGFILTDLVSGILLRNGYATIHCSSVKVGDRTVVIFAPPNTGKTITAIKLCENNDGKFIAEDIAITDGKNIFSAPWTSSFRFYDHKKESKVDRFINRLKKAIPLFQLIEVKNKKSINSYLENSSILNFTEITDVVVLGKGGLNTEVCKEEIFEKIINLNKYEFNYHKSPTMLVFNYFNRDFSIDKMFDSEKYLIQRMLRNAKVIQINSNDIMNYSNIIYNYLTSK